MNNKLYIFEGVDGSGKTTLGKEFARSIGGVYYKGLPTRPRPWKNFIDSRCPAPIRYVYYLLGNFLSHKEISSLLKTSHVVLDQSAYCTKAFHSVSLNRELKPPMLPLEPEAIIYLTASWEEIDKRLNERGGRKKLEDLEYLKAVDREYRRLFNGVSHVFYFENQSQSLDMTIERLHNFLKN